jgi:hypothetical protein
MEGSAEMGGVSDPGDGTFHYYTGEHMLLREEPAIVKAALQKIGVDLNNFDIKVTGIYARPRPIGFDFYSRETQALLDTARQNDQMREDDPSKLSGKFVGSMSKGHSFRQIGAGRALHLTIALNGWCDLHIDSIGFVDSCGYNAVRALGHGYWDLAPHLLPGAFTSFGKTGVAGVMVAPMKGVDGEVRPVIGIAGRW